MKNVKKVLFVTVAAIVGIVLFYALGAIEMQHNIANLRGNVGVLLILFTVFSSCLSIRKEKKAAKCIH